MANIVSIETEPLEDQNQPCGPEHEICTNYSRRAVFHYPDWQDRNLPAEFCWVAYTTYGMGFVTNYNDTDREEGHASFEETEYPFWHPGLYDLPADTDKEYLFPNDYNTTEFMWATDPEDSESVLDHTVDYVYDEGGHEHYFRNVVELEKVLRAQCASLNFERDIDPTADRS